MNKYLPNAQFIEIHNYGNNENLSLVIDPKSKYGYLVGGKYNWKLARCPDHKVITTFDFNEMGLVCTKCSKESD